MEAGAAKSRLFSGRFAFLLHGALWIALLVFILCIVPIFEQQFADYKIPLPEAAMILLSFSEWVYDLWFFWLILGCVLLVADGLILFGVPTNPSTRVFTKGWSILMVVVPLLILAIGVLGLLVPFVKVLEGAAN